MKIIIKTLRLRLIFFFSDFFSFRKLYSLYIFNDFISVLFADVMVVFVSAFGSLKTKCKFNLELIDFRRYKHLK